MKYRNKIRSLFYGKLFYPVAFFGASLSCNTAYAQLQNPIKAPTFAKFIEAIANIVVSIGGVIAVIFLIWAGFLFVTARGNEQQITKAKSAFTWAIIGTAVLLGAYVIAQAIVNMIESAGSGGGGGGPFSLI